MSDTERVAQVVIWGTVDTRVGDTVICTDRRSKWCGLRGTVVEIWDEHALLRNPSVVTRANAGMKVRFEKQGTIKRGEVVSMGRQYFARPLDTLCPSM